MEFLQALLIALQAVMNQWMGVFGDEWMYIVEDHAGEIPGIGTQNGFPEPFRKCDCEKSHHQ